MLFFSYLPFKFGDITCFWDQYNYSRNYNDDPSLKHIGYISGNVSPVVDELSCTYDIIGIMDYLCCLLPTLYEGQPEIKVFIKHFYQLPYDLWFGWTIFLRKVYLQTCLQTSLLSLHKLTNFCSPEIIRKPLFSHDFKENWGKFIRLNL